MARASHSLVTVMPPTANSTFSWTNAATSNGTKKIRRIVKQLGRFIAQTNYSSLYASATTWPVALDLPHPGRLGDSAPSVANPLDLRGIERSGTQKSRIGRPSPGLRRADYGRCHPRLCQRET